MSPNYVEIQDARYALASNYRDDAELRASLNELALAVFGFDFEDWYASGYWGDNYIPYSLMHQGKVVSNVSISKMEFRFGNEQKEAVQIGTVMTDQEYKGRGLSRFLMEWVLREWKDQTDFIYLFANDSVLDFYPKFNFEIVNQYQHSKVLKAEKFGSSIRQLDMDNDSDREFFTKTIQQSVPMAKLAMRNNISLIMFYCLSYKKNSIFYLEQSDAVVIAEIEGDTLLLNDVFSKTPVNLDHVIESLANDTTKKVMLGFTPLNDKGYDATPLTQNDTLFVLKESVDQLMGDKWMFPLLSHG